MEKGVPPHPFPCLFCGVSGLPGNQEPEVPPPRVPIACEDEINSIENRWTQSPFPSFTASSINLIACCQPASSNSNQSEKGFRRSPYLQSYTHSEVLPFRRPFLIIGSQKGDSLICIADRSDNGFQADILVRPYTSAQWHPAHVPLLFMADERDALLL